jgi:hypothetical protein
MENEIEIWKDIEGYEGLYQISNYGRVKSLERIEKKTLNQGEIYCVFKEKILKSRKSYQKRRSIYYYVILYKNKKANTLAIHRLIAHHFIQPIFNTDLVVNHKDLNGLNNDISNLEVITQNENITHYHNSIEKVNDVNKRINNYYNPIYQYDLNGNFICEWKSQNEAIRNGYNKHINDVLIGKRKTSGNSFWSYTKLH